MPKKDGREALAEIKSDPELRQIPVVVLTTSKAEEDIFRTYDLGVNSFITKPVTFAGLCEVVQNFSRYWFEIVDLPPRADRMPQAPESLNVLLVEDDEDDYVITRDLLAEQTRTRFELDWVATYEEGLRAIQERRHDVYLIDYRLGEWTGLDLVRQAFTDKGQAPVIVLTGQANYEVDLEATLLGVTDFLEKGQLDTALLERSIRYAVGHHATAGRAEAEPGALRAGRAGRQRRHLGLGPALRPASTCRRAGRACSDTTTRPSGTRSRSGWTGCIQTTSPSCGRRSIPTSRGRARTWRASTAWLTATGATAGCSFAAPRSATSTAVRPAWPAR